MQLFSLALISLLFSFASILFPSERRQQDTATPGQIETNYDREQDKTTIRLSPIQISGAKAQYHSVQIAAAFSHSGPELKRPEAVEFEVQTVVSRGFTRMTRIREN